MTPDGIEELDLRDDTISMFDEMTNDVENLLLDVHRARCITELPRRRFELHTGEAEHGTHRSSFPSERDSRG
jgi:hypothetical protein